MNRNPKTAIKFSILAMSTLIFIKKSKITDKLIGASFSKLEQLFYALM